MTTCSVSSGSAPATSRATTPAGSCTANWRPGTASCGFIPRAPSSDWPHPRSLGAATATTAVLVDDVDAHHRCAVEHGAEIVYGPVDQPYGYREYSARDPEGGLWSFMKRIP